MKGSFIPSNMRQLLVHKQFLSRTLLVCATGHNAFLQAEPYSQNLPGRALAVKELQAALRQCQFGKTLLIVRRFLLKHSQCTCAAWWQSAELRKSKQLFPIHLDAWYSIRCCKTCKLR